MMLLNRIYSFINRNIKLCFLFIYFEYYVKPKNYFIKLFGEKQKNIYLFILCPPHGGSTLLNSLLSTSKNVSSNNNIGTREGQYLPKVKKLMILKNLNDRSNENVKFDWQYIKREWMKYWDVTKKVLIEKSPPNLFRAFDIESNFNNSYFICVTRNPYAQYYSIKRRQSSRSSTRIAKFLIKSLKQQKKNIEDLKNVLYFSYEELTEKSDQVKEKLINFLPDLLDIDINFTSSAHNIKKTPSKITSEFNKYNIFQLKPDQIKKLNSVFKKEKAILDYFKYEIINSPDSRNK